jgi:hypothetical protein
MTIRRGSSLAAAIAATFAYACSALDAPPTAAPATACQAGTTVSCGCIDGKDGVQACLPDGSRYSACDCSGGGGTHDGGGGGDGGGSMDGGGNDGGGGCTSGRIACGGACVDPSNDPANCGGCAHSCRGGACTNGMCPVTTIAAGGQTTISTSSIAVDTKNVYWTFGSVTATQPGTFAAPINGGSADWLNNDALGVVSDGTRVYFQNPNSVGYWIPFCTGVNCPTTATLFSGSYGANYPQTILLTSTELFWTEGKLGVIWRGPKTGGTATSFATLPNGAEPYALAMDATTMYALGQSGVYAIPFATGVATSLQALGPNNSGAIAIDATYVYYALAFGNVAEIDRVAKTGGSMTTLVSGVDAVFGMVADGGYVYFTSEARVVGRVPAGGGDVITLANRGEPYALTVDATSVYWTDIQTGSVYRVAK